MPRPSWLPTSTQETVQQAVETVRRWPPVESVVAWAQADPQARVLVTLGVIVALWLGRALLIRAVRRRVASPDTVLLWRQVTGYLALLVGVLYVADVWFDGLTAVLTALSLVAAALTIVSKELLLNLMAWPVITWRQLFGVGDRVAIGEQAGVVSDMGVLFVTLAETRPDGDSGRLVKVPNASVLTQPVRNHSRGLPYVWLAVRVPLTPPSDWEAAETLVRPIAEGLAAEVAPYETRALRGTAEEGVYRGDPVGIRLGVADGKLALTVRLLVPAGEEAATEDAFWRRTLAAFAGREDAAVALA